MGNERKRIKIGMMEIMPIFDIPAWEDIEEKFGSLDAAYEKLKAEKGWKRATVSMTTILCNRALELAGDEPLEERRVLLLMKPGELIVARTACIFALADGLSIEHKSDTENERIDLVLQAIEKKAEPEA